MEAVMKMGRVVFLFVFQLAFLVPCFAHHMAVVVNKDNTAENITSAHLTRIVRAEMKMWPDGKNVVLVLHKNSNGEMETLERLSKLSASALRSHFAAHKDFIVWVDSDAEVLKIVQSTQGAIGFVDVRSVDNSINVVHVDGKLPMESGYLPH